MTKLIEIYGSVYLFSLKIRANSLSLVIKVADTSIVANFTTFRSFLYAKSLSVFEKEILNNSVF